MIEKKVQNMDTFKSEKDLNPFLSTLYANYKKMRK